MRTYGLVILISLSAVVGCSQQSGHGPADQTEQDIFATRPQASRPEVTIVKLRSPALFQVGKKTEYGWIIPNSARQRIKSEQDQFIADLKSLDPNVRILFRYQFVLNALTIVTTTEVLNQISAFEGVASVEARGSFSRPQALPGPMVAMGLEGPTSVSFIGADQAQKSDINGKGVRVGVIDTGIDYTHAMLGGRGLASDYASVQPDLPSSFFPNEKVVGGIDLAGSDYNSGSELPIEYIPKPDSNPIDEAGHGSHVAGTIAGIGDGINSYSGVAPSAKLYAIKVFGKAGSTSDAVVIAGLEYAANPSGDGNPEDQLDVVNLSLGSAYGAPHLLYSEAIKNLTRAGTAVVAAAGNAGQKDFIVGAPGSVSEAISVAASVDGSFVNWKYAASRLTLGPDTLLVKAVEGPISKPVASADGVSGQLVDIGFGDQPLTDDQKNKLKGQVAFVSRGKVAFAAKISLAFQNGAVGVVVMNNAPGDPISMGGDGKIDIPAIMVSQDIGQRIKAALATMPVRVDFKTNETIQEPNRIDTITSFSSKGPRSEDDLIKPEIAAPGENVLSAAMGSGNQGVRFNGTSMATPHITGVYALLKQKHPDLAVPEMKSLMMNTAKPLQDAAKTPYPISVIGAGRVQVVNALASDAIATASLSLGFIQSADSKIVGKILHLKNLSEQPQTFTLNYQGANHLGLSGPSRVEIEGLGEREIPIRARIAGVDAKTLWEELDGQINIKTEKTELHVPVMAIRAQVSDIYLTQTYNNKLAFENASVIPGLALPFNLLGSANRKLVKAGDEWKSRSCELKSVGYRFIDRDQKTYLQFGFQLYRPLNHWQHCELNVQFDVDGDGTADFELAGVATGNDTTPYASLLLNATKARAIRSDYETKIRQGLPVPPPNYNPAMISASVMYAFAPSTIGVTEVEVSQLNLKSPNVKIKVASSYDDAANAVQPDDFLSQDWQAFTIDPLKQAFSGLPEALPIRGRSSASSSYVKTDLPGILVIYYPLNKTGRDAEIINY